MKQTAAKVLVSCSCKQYDHKSREAVGTECVCQDIDLDNKEILTTRSIKSVTIENTRFPGDDCPCKKK